MYNNSTNHQEASAATSTSATDIYALLSSDMNDDPSNFMLDMFNNPLSTNDISQDLINFDFSQHYTPSDPFFLQRRRHSVAVNIIPQQPQQSYVPHTMASMDHRASMPNIFNPPNQSDRIGPTSVKTNNNTPIQFNTLPWSNELPVRRKRVHSDFDASYLQPSDCPLPMSGVPSRRVSMATPTDISTWHKMLDEPSKRPTSNSSQSFQHRTPSPLIKKEEIEDEPEDYPNITDADVEAAKTDSNAIPRRQKLRYEGDEYTPKWVRYTGQSKEGYCDTCATGKWLQLKNSAYWYHKQFFHGISSISGKQFQNPIEQRYGEHDSLEGLCHQCKEFVPVCNSKRKNSVLWYRHAHKCHIYDKPKPRNTNGRQEQQSSKKIKYF